MATPEVVPYSIDVLRTLFARPGKSEREIINRKSHCDYFQNYFAKLKAKTIVVENEYIDRDFLEDFSAYYVRCFHRYDSRCTRLHFFDIDFTDLDLKTLLRGEVSKVNPELLNSAYLGFIVVKPLPQTVVGRTCLKTYEDVDGHRTYPITRTYSANLFGISLRVESLAFQEQDHVVAACATSALWSAFHGTGPLFQHAIPSPVEITRLASTNMSDESRNLPNHGLNIQQMAVAIRGVGLEPFAIGTTNIFGLKSALYAYLIGRVPVLLAGQLFDSVPTPNVFLGRHAVAVTGFGSTEKADSQQTEFLCRSNLIDRIYAHDDQVGPFARMLFDNIAVNTVVQGRNISYWSLSSSFSNNGVKDKVRFVPEALLIPLYHKIRIPLDIVQTTVIQLDRVLNFLHLKAGLPLGQQLQWDVHLSTVNTFKNSFFNMKGLRPNLREEILSRALPRFMWRATAYGENKPIFDLLFDATDIEQGSFFVLPISYDINMSAVISGLLGEPVIKDILVANVSIPVNNILKQLATVIPE